MICQEGLTQKGFFFRQAVLGQQLLYEVQMIAGRENGGWVLWDKGLASTKQSAEVKTPRPPTQLVPGALPWPGDTAQAGPRPPQPIVSQRPEWPMIQVQYDDMG